MSKFTEIATSLEFDSTVYKIVFNRPKRLNAMSAKVIGRKRNVGPFIFYNVKYLDVRGAGRCIERSS